MAVVQESTSTYTGGNGDTFVLAHPTGLQAGDLMVLFVTNALGTSVTSGWTSLFSIHQYGRLRAEYKIATAGDVSAGSTTFTRGGSHPGTYMGLLVRYSGVDGTTPIGTDISTNTTTSSFYTLTTTTITPDYADSLLVVGGYQFGNTNSDITSATIVTDDPGLTAGADVHGNIASLDTAIGIRPETTATGTVSVTMDTSDEISVFAFTINESQATDIIRPPAINSTGSFMMF